MNQFILGGGDPVLAGTQIDEQIQLLEGQKQLLMARQRQMQQGAIVQQQQQLGQQPQAVQVSLWDSIDAEVEPLTNEQRQLLLSNEEYVNNYFDEREAYDTVEEMYHVKGDKKYVGEKFDMDKAHKVYEKLRDADGYTIGDIYVAINAQYHDYCELFEKWFGSNFDEKIIASAVDFWFEDDDFDGNKVWKYFNEM